MNIDEENRIRVKLVAPAGYRQSIDVFGKEIVLWPFCEEYHG